MRIVEDDPDIARWLATMLPLADADISVSAQVGYRNLCDVSHWEGVDIAIVDLVLRDAPTGDHLLRWLAANAPHIRRIAFSASALTLSGLPVGLADAVMLKGSASSAQVVEAIRGR